MCERVPEGHAQRDEVGAPWPEGACREARVTWCRSRSLALLTALLRLWYPQRPRDGMRHRGHWVAVSGPRFPQADQQNSW